MKRDKLEKLRAWRDEPYRKPLIIKGARQVGKTWLVRKFGEEFEEFIEINFERNPEYDEIFNRGLDPQKIISEISAATGKVITPGKSLLFFDEVQQSPNAFKSLRYFYEELPQLHVIAAGSLLGFIIQKVSTGVGRVSYLNLYPLTFGEFLHATGNEQLRNRIMALDTDEILLEIHHIKLLDLVREYMLTGGMPGVISAFVDTGNIHRCQEIKSEIIQSFIDDFVKYAKAAEIPHLKNVFTAIPFQLGQKFIYSKIGAGVRSYHFSKALDLLETAGLVYKVYHSKADGIPVQARINSSRFKVILFDVGLLQQMLKVDLKLWMTTVDIAAVNKGAIAEQFVGQELAALISAGKFSNLTYWHREKRGSIAEVDYLFEKEGVIYPIEIKSSVQGGMKSMYAFLKEKHSNLGIKISKYPFSFDGTIRTIPLYAVEKLFSRQ